MWSRKHKQQITYTFLFCVMKLMGTAQASWMRFTDNNGTSRYLFGADSLKFSEINTNLTDGLCDVGSDVNAGNYNNASKYHFTLLKGWFGAHEPTTRGSLFRITDDPANKTLETCLIEFIDAVNAEYEAQLAASAATSDKFNTPVFIGCMAGLILLVYLFVRIGLPYLSYRDSNVSDEKSDARPHV